MSNNESNLWDEKYKKTRHYENLADVFKFVPTNPTIGVIKSYIKENSSILEVGSGTGELISYIGFAYKNVVTTGIDFSAESVRKSNNFVKEFGFSTTFIQSDIKNMPFENESFDIVFGDQVLGHVDDVKLALQEIYRVTKGGGIVAFTAGNRLRPDGWYLHRKLSRSHEGYQQKSMFPWILRKKLSDQGFEFLKYYGDILLLSRNAYLIKNFFVSKKTRQQSSMLVSTQINKNEKSKFKSLYYILDKFCPQFLKVTTGVISRKKIFK